MKNLLTVACLSMCANIICSPGVLAADYGIGVSAKSNDAWIYAPIEFTPAFRLEPSIRFTSNKLDSSQNLTSSFGLTNQVESHSKSHQREFGLGAFGLTAVTDSLRLYYGGRVTYVNVESRSTTTFITRFGSSTDTDTETTRQSQDGYRLSPTLGFEYFINQRFSIGGEAEWFYLDLDGKVKNFDSGVAVVQPPVKFSQKSNGTDTHVILRYRF